MFVIVLDLLNPAILLCIVQFIETVNEPRKKFARVSESETGAYFSSKKRTLGEIVTSPLCEGIKFSNYQKQSNFAQPRLKSIIVGTVF